MKINTDQMLTAGLLNLVQLSTGSELMRHLLDLVTAEFANDGTGAEKKTRVTEAAKAIKGDLGYIAKGMGGWMLSVAIDVAHAYLVTHAAADAK